MIITYNGIPITLNGGIVNFNQQINVNIDPISLGQPLIYYQTFDTNFLSPNNPVSGTPINTLYRYNDNLLITTGGTNTLPAKWDTLGGYNMLYFNGITVNGVKTGATYNTQINMGLLQSPNYSFTIYMVMKTILEYSTVSSAYTTSYIFSQAPTGPPSNFLNSTVSPSSSSVKFNTRSSSSDILNLTIESNVDVDELNNKNLRIFSVRAQDTNDTISNAAYTYVNGVETGAYPQLNVPFLTTSYARPFIIGGFQNTNNSLMTPNYNGYMAEIIIFDTMHDVTTHSGVVNFLKNRWGIN